LLISTKNLSALPSVDGLRRLTQSLATLDAIIQRDWEGRYYSFNSHWDKKEQMASMRNGEGDSWFCVFSPFGAFLKGCGHESQMSPRNNGTGKTWPGVLDDVPDVFRSFLSEPAFSMEDTTFCIWRTHADVAWRNGNVSNPVGMDPDGSAHLLSIFDGNPQTYSQWAEEYYKRLVSVVLVEHLYLHKPLTESVVRELNPRANLAELSSDLLEIGYPFVAN
jgi:hypothetical protein